MTKKLIRDCRKLDRKAQREMVNHLSPFLFPVCRRYSNSYEDAKDLLQESLISIFNNIDKCNAQEEIPFKSWCRRICINNALSKIRKKSNQKTSNLEVIHQVSSPPSIYSQLNVEEILSLLQFIPETHRTVFNLAIIDGYAHKEIANFLNIKESSSRTFLTRARQALQQLILKQDRKVAE